MELVKVTKKRKTEIILPGQTEIYQSNRITNGKFQGFTLIQSRVLVCIIKQLQEPIKSSMSGLDWEQLEMFRTNTNKEFIQIPIPLKEIAKPKQYKEVYDSIVEMMSLKMKVKPVFGNENVKIAVLINAIESSRKIKGASIVFIQVMREVANELIAIEKNSKGQPQFYTKYLYEVAMNASNKYTYKLYWIIASWKSKGGFRMSLSQLRESLGISEEEYPEFSDFKRRVLIPIQKNLEKKADCWFNCKEKGFEIKDGKKVIALNFKIIVPELLEEVQDKKDYIRNLLIMHFRFLDSHFKAIQPILGDFLTKDTASAMLHKITELKLYIKDLEGTNESIKDIAAYTVKTLLQEFNKQ